MACKHSSSKFGLGIVITLCGIHFVIGTLIIIVGSLLTCIMASLLKDGDLRTIIYSTLPKQELDLVYTYTRYVLKLIYRKS